MRLLFTIDTRDYDPAGRAFVRPSVRAIIQSGGKLLMVHSLKYDYYKFPGGGIEPGEGMTEALTRETAEEAGVRLKAESIREYGCVHRVQRSDRGDGYAYFVQDNYYYLCDIDGECSQRLDDYEAEEHFTPELVDPLAAIRVNREEQHGPKDQLMLEREARVIELLIKEGKI